MFFFSPLVQTFVLSLRTLQFYPYVPYNPIIYDFESISDFVIHLHQCRSRCGYLKKKKKHGPSTLPPTPWLQRWYPWGRDSEEPEWLVARAGVEARAQSAVLSASARSQPQPAHRLALPQRRLPAGQTPLQLSHNTLPAPLLFLLVLSLVLSSCILLSVFCFSLSASFPLLVFFFFQFFIFFISLL